MTGFCARTCRHGPLWVLCLPGVLVLSAMAGCGSGVAPAISTENEGTTAAADPIGERIFLDTRFAKFFFTHMTGYNTPLVAGDPAMATVENGAGGLPGPFAGKSINCRSCHFVTEFQGVAGAGNRTYADFTTRSPLPETLNGYGSTLR